MVHEPVNDPGDIVECHGGLRDDKLGDKPSHSDESTSPEGGSSHEALIR